MMIFFVGMSCISTCGSECLGAGAVSVIGFLSFPFSSSGAGRLELAQ